MSRGLSEKLIREWHPTKNGSLTPKDFTYGSAKKVWWLCEKGHEWEASIKSRGKGIGCPYCSNRKVTAENSFASKCPELIKLWHPTKNGNLTPNDVSFGSHKKVWWICEKGHEWLSTIVDIKNGCKCPYCSNKKISKDNCLTTTHPELAKEWHPTKNGDLTPDDVVFGSHKKVWWSCSKNKEHEWQTEVRYRTREKEGTGCPHCNTQTSFPEQCFVFYLKRIFPLVTNRHIFTINNKKVEVDIFIPELNISIEYDGYYYHKEREAMDLNKNKMLYNNTKLIRIRECTLNSIMEYDVYNIHIKSKKTTFRDIENALKELLKHIIDTNNLEDNIVNIIKYNKINIHKDKMHILNNISSIELENSLEKCFPDIAKEWNYEKNMGLLPSSVSKASSLKVWWKCFLYPEHEWETKINDRTRAEKNGRKPCGCPYCSNKKLWWGNTLAYRYPEIAAEWHYELNGDITPDDIVFGTKTSYWWKCKNNPDHIWKARVANRTIRNTKCRKCSDKATGVRNRIPLSTIKQKAVEKGWECLSPSTVKYNEKLVFKCEEGHIFEKQTNDIMRGCRCPICKLNKKK